MPPLYRILEVALYALLNFLPYLVLAMYTFQDQYRFSKPVTYGLIAAVTVAQMVLGNLAAFSGSDAGLLSAASTLIYAAFYFVAVKAYFGKTLFTLLILSNLANLVVICSKCLEGLLFGPAIAYQAYRWTNSVCMFIVHLIITVPLWYYFCRYYRKVVENQTNKSVWNYLWLIPATFYLFWYHHIYGSTESSLELALQPSHALFLLTIDLGSFLVYHIVIKMRNAQQRGAELERYNHQLAMQSLQYENLQDRINEARQAKHDVRHHITVMDGYLKSGDLDGLEQYLNSYKRSLPDDNAIVFCRHHATNALLLYFAQLAKNNDIDYDVIVADIPKQIKIPETALSVILGNLLENAVEATSLVTDRPKKIEIKVKTSHDSVFIKISNTFNGTLKRDKSGKFLSTKHEGRGIGLTSVRNIIKQYNGICEISQDDGMFSVTVFLNIPEK